MDPSTVDRSRWRALVIGINSYRHAPDLAGAVNDARRAVAFARTALGVPEDNVVCLTDARATRQTLVDALWALAEGDLRPDDQVLVHYSGHGAQMRDPWGQSPTGYIESLVAHDSGPGGAYNIPDRTVGALLDRITRKTPHVTVVLDCCHSGSGTRKRWWRARLTDADGRTPPPDLDAAILPQSNRRVGFEGDDMPYTVLAACRDRELALEYAEREDGRSARFGLFSSFVYPTFETAPPGVSYRALMERVSARVNARARYQHPQCEGRRDRVLFGGHDVRRDPFLTVTRVIGDQVELDGGALHGLTVGEPLALHPSTVNTRAELGEPLACARVLSIQASTARARIGRLDAPAAPLDPEAVPDDRVLKHARVVRLRPPTAGGRVRFDHHPSAPPLALERAPDDAQWRLAGDGEEADIGVYVGPEYVDVLDASGHPRFSKRRDGDGWMADGLSMVARFDRVDRLINPDPGSALQGRLELGLRQIVDPADPTGGPVVARRGDRVVLPYDPDRPDARYVVEITNRGAIDVFPRLLMLSANLEIRGLYPRVTSDRALAPGGTLFAGRETAAEQLEVYLPDAPYWPRADNTLLLIASRSPLALDVLDQGDIDGQPPVRRSAGGLSGDHRDGPLADLLRDAAAGRRMLRARSVEDWGTARLQITVMRKPKPLPLSGVPQVAPIGLEVHAAEQGGAITAAEFDRLGAFVDLPRPPLEVLLTDGLRPVRSPAAGAGESPLVIRLDGAVAGPLAVRVPTETAPLTPVAFDGDEYVVVGAPAGPGGATLLAAAVGYPILLTRPA